MMNQIPKSNHQIPNKFKISKSQCSKSFEFRALEFRYYLEFEIWDLVISRRRRAGG